MPQVPWWRRKEMSGGQAVEQTIHVTDMARYLFGDVKSVYAAGCTGLMADVPDYNIEDSSTATLVFENGLAATIFSACFLSGGRGKGGIDIFTKDLNIEYRERRSITIIQDGNSELVEVQNDFWQDMDNDFIDAVRKGDDSALKTTYADAVKTQEVVMAVNRSIETGRSGSDIGYVRNHCKNRSRRYRLKKSIRAPSKISIAAHSPIMGASVTPLCVTDK